MNFKAVDYEEMEMTKEWYINTYKKLVNNARIPKRYKQKHKIYVQEEDREAYEFLNELKNHMTEFVDNGTNLLFYSKTVGCGKTMWAIELLKAYLWDSLNKGGAPNGVYINIPSLLVEIKMGIDDPESKEETTKLQKQLVNSKLVILDDIGVKGLSEYDQNMLYTWIDKRTSEGKSILYTTNLTPDELAGCLGTRLTDRILKYSKVIEFKGGSFRGIE